MTSHSSATAASLLIVGCGDIGLRVAGLLAGRVRLYGLTSTAARFAELRAAGVRPILGDLDDPASLGRLAGLARRVLYLAPPPATGAGDPRLGALLATLARRTPPRGLVYASTTGVYGDCGGDWVDETRTPAPATPRARRRADAEARLRAWALATGARASVLRIPGIYAADRAGGRPQERLLRGTPSLREEDDVYTNHIHADDLARACVAALWRGRPQRVTHVSDDLAIKAGDYQDLVAALLGLPRPERLPRAEALARFTPMQASFLGESRRLSNRRLKAELRLRLRYPSVREALRDGA